MLNKLIFFILFLPLSELKTPPPGTVFLSDNIYIDNNDITVLDWKEYVMLELRNHNKPFYPDTNFYIDGINYYNSKNFDDKPVYFVSYKAIEAYTKWRTDFINSKLSSFSNKSRCRGKFYVKNHKKDITVLYRIAKESEYLQAINLGIITKSKFPNLFLGGKDKREIATFRCVAEVYFN